MRIFQDSRVPISFTQSFSQRSCVISFIGISGPAPRARTAEVSPEVSLEKCFSSRDFIKSYSCDITQRLTNDDFCAGVYSGICFRGFRGIAPRIPNEISPGVPPVISSRNYRMLSSTVALEIFPLDFLRSFFREYILEDSFQCCSLLPIRIFQNFF